MKNLIGMVTTGFAALMVLANAAAAAEITVLSAIGMQSVLEDLGPRFERATGHKLAISFVTAGAAVKRAQGGEAADVVIAIRQGIDGLVQNGKAAADNVTVLASAGISLAIRKGAPKPDISSPDALKRTLLAAKSIAHSRSPNGIYLTGLFKKLGIADEIKAKVKEVEGEPVARLVARGEVEIGFQQISEIIHVAGVDYLGPLPPDVQHITVFASGLAATSSETDAAKTLVRYLTGPAAGPVLKKHGLEPG